jgi:hypothetical protein
MAHLIHTLGSYYQQTFEYAKIWTEQTGSGSNLWWSVASSLDGTKLIAGGQNIPIYRSTDSGVTWNPQATSGSWYSVASSSDGTKLFAENE